MTEENQKPRFSFKRLLPLLILIGLIAAVYYSGLHNYFHARAIADSRDSLQGFVAANLLLAILIFMAGYAAAVALSIPGAAFLTILGGFLFGQWLGGSVVVIAATVGATIIFLVAKTALGDALAARAGPTLERVRAGFADDAFNYLLFLRLVPAFPFWFVNIAPAFTGVATRTYVLATLIGIIPGTFAYAFIGGGLDSIITSAQANPAYQACLAEESSGARAVGSCALPVDFGDVITPQILLAFAALGLVALIPVIVKRLRARKNA